MAAQRTKLTQRFVADYPLPKSGRVTVRDTVVTGLYVSVSHSGVKAFYWYGRVKGHPTRMCLGRFPEVSVEAARDDARTIMGDAASGKVPVPKSRRKRDEVTLRQAFEDWMANYSKPHKRTTETDRKRFDRVLLRWTNRGLSNISRADVTEHHVELGSSAGPYAANKMLELLTSIYGHARDNLEWHGPIPTKGVVRFDTTERERFLSEDELIRFFEALPKLRRPLARDFFLLCLFTGGRRSNVCAMEWSELDLKARRWTIPKGKSKSKKAITLPLTDVAVEILVRRQETATTQWVLPSHSKSGHYEWPRESWNHLLKEAKLKDLRIHDLRRTLGSWQAMTGASLLIISKSLGQTSTAATGIYARLQLDPVRASIETATSAIVSASQRKPKS